MSTLPSCPLCGESKRMKRPKLLYGREVCKKCASGFANRRQFAYVVDIILLYTFEIVTGGLLGVAMGSVGLTSESAINSVEWFLMVGFLTILLAKDGFEGRSPGKTLMGVQAIDRETGVPIGFGRSIQRNLVTLVPVMPLIIAVQMMKGYRTGDRWAHSKVIWRKYADHPVFAVKPPATTGGFSPPGVELAPTYTGDNPYQAPQH